MFQIKDFRDILSGMVNVLRGSSTQVTDFNPGSVTRTLLEASASEVEDLYHQMYHGVTEAIPVAIYSAFGFERRPAVAAFGDVRFQLTAPAASNLVIPAGTRVETLTGIAYLTQVEATIVAGSGSVDVFAQCTQTGTAGNVSASAITVLSSALPVDQIYNPAAFVTGRDLESDDARHQRFQEYIAALTRATKRSLGYAVSQAERLDGSGDVIEYVKSYAILEPFMTDPTEPVGFVRVVISSASGSVSDEMIEMVQRLLDGYVDASGVDHPGWKAAGVVIQVERAVEQLVAVEAIITSDRSRADAIILAEVEQSMRNVITYDIGDPLNRAELIAAGMRIQGVENVVLSAPIFDVEPDVDEIVKLDTVSLTVI